LDTNRSVEFISNFLNEYDEESDNKNEKRVKSVKNGKRIEFENSAKLKKIEKTEIDKDVNIVY
jgi:hypothetical protein